MDAIKIQVLHTPHLYFFYKQSVRNKLPSMLRCNIINNWKLYDTNKQL